MHLKNLLSNDPSSLDLGVKDDKGLDRNAFERSKCNALMSGCSVEAHAQ